MLLLLKRSIYAILTFAIMSCFFLLAFSLVETSYDTQTQMNQFISTNAIAFNILDGDDVPRGELQKLVTSENVSAFYKVFPFSGAKAVWLNAELSVDKLISGRFFNLSDMTSREPVAVVGKNKFAISTEENGEHFMFHDGQLYRVIGVLGVNDKESNLDNIFLISFAPYLNEDFPFHFNGEYIADGNKSQKPSATAFDNIINIYGSAVREIGISQYVPSFLDTLGQTRVATVILSILGIMLALNVINVSAHFISLRYNKYAVKKVLGATSGRIIFEVIAEYQFAIIIGFAIGYVLFILANKLDFLSLVGFKDSMRIVTLIAAFLLSNFIGILTAIVPAVKINSIAPSVSMRG
ncbi:hypothetical protein FACS1894105_12390 [Clostridia bacterium]|nr:hypothetical protein FACS1894105_12390 [Clostridia bacterium]